MAQSADMSVRFWGVRGSIPCPGPETVRYGGNTPCLEVVCGDRLLVFDAGTGIRPLGQAILARGGPMVADLFFTHSHFDHICGLPFFAPLFVPGNEMTLWAGHLLPALDLKAVLGEMMMAPLFPVPLDIFKATLRFHDFRAGETLSPHPGIVLETAPLNHPNGATGYRVEYGGKSIAYITDTEHQAEGHDPNVMTLVDHADVMIYDATYSDEEYPAHAGWGHSTWQEGVRIADAAGVGTLVIFHHDPSHDDAFMDGVAAAAAALRPGTVVAREGMVLRP